MQIEFKIQGIEELRKRLSPEAARDSLFSAMRKAQAAVFAEARVLASKHYGTAAMSKSLKADPVKKGDEQAVIRIGGPGAPYAPYVHEGTRPHVITPRNKKALRWQTFEGMAYAKRVRHPGYKGDPFMKTALDVKRPEIMAIFRDAFTEAWS